MHFEFPYYVLHERILILIWITFRKKLSASSFTTKVQLDILKLLARFHYLLHSEFLQQFGMVWLPSAILL